MMFPTEGYAGKAFIHDGKIKFNEAPSYEPVPLKTDEDCCCCCGCECTCTLDILGEVIELSDFTCELAQSFCFVKHQPLTSPIEATQSEFYTELLECGEYPEIGGINREVIKESRMESHLVSFIRATVTKGGPWSIEVEQTDKLITFYYRRISINIDQVCTIPDSVWQLNPETNEPEIIDPNYEPSCIKCKLGSLNSLSGAGVKPCCTDPTSEISVCEFSVVDGKGQIRIVGSIVGLWEYEEGKCMEPALTGPTISCEDKDNDKKYYDLNSHTWDDARNGRVGCLSPVMEGLGCSGELLRIRRKTWRFVPLLPEYDDDDIPDSQCLSYQKGNVAIELMSQYDSRDLGLYDADGLFDLEFEIDSTRSFNPNTETSGIIGSPVEVSGDTDTEEYSTDVPFHYSPEAPKCRQCMMTVEIGVDTVEIMEPGCDPYGQFCYYNMELIAEYEAVHKRITDPLYECLQKPIGESCDYEGPDEGIYMEENDEIKERYYVNSSSKVTIFSGVDVDGVKQWYADIEQDDHLVHMFYERKVFISDFGSGCFYNNCGVVPEEEPDDCGFTLPDLYEVYTYPPLVGGTPSACFFESDVLTTSCGADRITLYRETKEAWGWGIVNTLYGQIFGSSCVGPLFVHPPYKDIDLFPGCKNKSDPWTEVILPPAVLPCDVGQGLDGEQLGTCGGTGFSYRKHRYKLVRKDRETNSTPIINWCREVKESNLEWEFVTVLEDTGIRAGTRLYFEQDGTIFYNRNLAGGGFYTPTGATGSGSTTFDPFRPDSTGGSFTIASSPLTIRPEFFMSLGATSIVCPDVEEEV